MTIFKCSEPNCSRTFTRKGDLARHISTVHTENPKKSSCKECNREFIRADALKRHERICTGQLLRCQKCNQPFRKQETLDYHLRKQHPNMEDDVDAISFPEMPMGSDTQEVFDQICAGTSSTPPTLPLPDSPTMNIALSRQQVGLAREYGSFWRLIRTSYKYRTLQNEYNVRLPFGEDPMLILGQILRAIHHGLECAYKINFSFGAILRNRETSEFRYWYSGANARVLSEPTLISTNAQFDRFCQEIAVIDPDYIGHLIRPDTISVCEMLTNVTIYVNKITTPPVGHPYGDDDDTDSDEEDMSRSPRRKRFRKSTTVSQDDMSTANTTGDVRQDSSDRQDSNSFIHARQYSSDRQTHEDENVSQASNGFIHVRQDSSDIQTEDDGNIPGTNEASNGFIHVRQDSSDIQTEDDGNIPGTNEILEGLLDLEAEGPAVPERTENNHEIRTHLRNSRHINSFFRDMNNRPYKDNKCFFRCLASQRNGFAVRVTEGQVRHFMSIWADWCRDNNRQVPNLDRFSGFRVPNDLSDLEDCYRCNIFVYTLTNERDDAPDIDDGDIYERLAEEEIERDEREGADESELEEVMTISSEDIPTDVLAAKLLVRSMKRYQENMFLNLNGDHFSLIKNINKYAHFWQCHICNRVLRRKGKYNAHIKTCKGAVTKVYPGGGYRPPKTIFQRLRDEGVQIQDTKYPYATVFDFECRFEEEPEMQNPARLQFVKRLIPVSVSVKSNVPGADETRFYLNRDPKQLIRDFVGGLDQISQTAYENVSQEFAEVTSVVNRRAGNVTELRLALNRLRSQRGPAQEIEALENQISEFGCWETLQKDWQRWLRQLPVVGYNSGKFDINLIRSYLVPHLYHDADTELLPPIVRGSAYLLLATDKLMFLDITNFLSPGISYSKWLSGVGIEETKGIFPYEWLTDFERLEQRYLPPKDAFYSTLRQAGITDEDYERLERVWVEEGMETMTDFLKWYNNKDVEPFLKALSKMSLVFTEMGIDMLKSGNISLPGLASVRMFRDIPPDVIFQVFDEENKDFRDAIKNNIVGGPSIIFKRAAFSGMGSIKDSGVPPQKIVGYDANSLYLFCLALAMPTGLGMKWEPVDGPGREIPTRAGLESKEESRAHLAQNLDKKFKRAPTAKGVPEVAYVNYAFREPQSLINSYANFVDVA